MTDLLHTTQTDLLNWTSKAIDTGWLAPHALEEVTAVNAATPGQLFTSSDRPLVVGFFGGTGVGKSSLMNRLAGEAIARASAERPTSTDITAYIHTSVRVDRLPSDFPMGKLRTTMHNNADYASVLWLDMPDFDSVETTHRDLVEQWLPFIDVLVYVVSPERYRDDEGWRLLQQHGEQHAWLFVINHWDRGDPVQRDDFHSLLQAAGLNNPLLFCTDCNPHKSTVNDDFEEFDNTIRALADQQLIQALEQHGVFQRFAEFQKTAEGLEKSLGDNALIERWQSQWQEQWARHTDEITQTLQWQIPTISNHFAEPKQPLWQRFMPGIGQRLAFVNKQDKPTTDQAQDGVNQLLDEAMLQRVNDGVLGFVHDARTEPVHTDALAVAVSRRAEELPARLYQNVNNALQASLQKPGNLWQRGLHKTLGALSTLLPLASLGWAGFKLIHGFYIGGGNASQYLGVNFAVHSAMLAGVAWAVPYVLHKKTKPSPIKAANRGLTLGLKAALADVEQHVAEGVSHAGEQRSILMSELQKTSAKSLPLTDQTDQPAVSDALKRLLIN